MSPYAPIYQSVNQKENRNEIHNNFYKIYKKTLITHTTSFFYFCIHFFTKQSVEKNDAFVFPESI